jgi:hypothetical protein
MIRSRCIINYLGVFLGFLASCYWFQEPTLLVRLLGSIGATVGSQLFAVVLIVIPKLFMGQVSFLINLLGTYHWQD